MTTPINLKSHTYNWSIQPYKIYKGVSKIETIPSNARPLTNGNWDSSQFRDNLDGNAFLPRPIKHWRKQLQPDPVRGGSKSIKPDEVFMPGGTTFLNSNIDEERKCCYSRGINTKLISNIYIEKYNDFCKTENCSYTVTSQNVEDGWNGPIGKKICCNPVSNVIKPATTVLSKKYYSDSRSYLKSRNRLHNQKQTLSQVPNVEYYKDGKELYPNNEPLGPETFLMPDCVNICKKIQPVTIYKPNNRNFSVQGATDSSNRTNKLRYDTVKTAASSLQETFGQSAANAGKYLINYTTPYNIKSKYQAPKYCPQPFIPSIRGTFIYEFDNAGYSGNIPLPLISTNKLIYTYNVEIIGSVTRVTVNYIFYTDDENTNDGLSFNTLDGSTVKFYNDLGGNLTIIQFGDIPLSKGGGQFINLTKLIFASGSGKPTIPFFGTSLSFCFNGCSNFNSDISLWDTSNVTNMSQMFQNATLFNQNIGGWNVSKVTVMSAMFLNGTGFNNGGSNSIQNWSAPLCVNFNNMFNNATSFNQPLTNLVNTSHVDGCTFGKMFYQAYAFNQNIGSWDVSNITSMYQMFYQASVFNNGGSNTIQNWSAPLCTSFSNMFQLASVFNQPLTNLVDTSLVLNCSLAAMFQQAPLFNQNIGGWNLSNVINTKNMFYLATSFNNGGSADIQNWSAPLCTDFSIMFQQATSFNQPLTNLVNTSGVSGCSFDSMFRQATIFNQNIGSWNVSKATTMANMFYQASAFNNFANNSIQSWNAPLCTSFAYMFISTPFNQPIPNLVNTSGVSGCTLNNMFQLATVFNQNIGSWDVSKVTSFSGTFYQAFAFNNGGSTSIQSWSAPLCISYDSTFYGTPFNQPIPNLVNTSGVVGCNFVNMFNGATAFNQNIGSWNMINATQMNVMFIGATSFNNGGSNTIQSWSAPKCITFAQMFQAASQFNQPLTNLVNTSGVAGCPLNNMFNGATQFNQNIGGWNVSKATLMNSMFQSATAFNNGGSPDIQNWSAPLCINFSLMFSSAPAFNQPLTNLVNTSGVASCNMTSMFNGSPLFNQNIGGWNVSKATNMTSMFQGATTFNNGGSNTIQNWSAHICLFFPSMFNNATSFNQPLTNLVNTSGVTGCQLNGMFQGATQFNQNIGGWDVSKATLMNSMFQSATTFNNGGSNSIQNWSSPLCTSFALMFANVTSFNQPLTNLVNTSGVAGCALNGMFSTASIFNQNIGGWNVSKATLMTSMFQSATAFNNGGSNTIQSWSAPICTSFSQMFYIASAFNQPLTNLVNTSGVAGCTFDSMFRQATVFTQDIGGWNVSKATNMLNMFLSATAFNNGGSNTIQNWSAPLCTTFAGMFQSATAFNQPLTNLVNTSGIAGCILASMFQSATQFNQNIGGWNVSKATNMLNMFLSATAFNNGGSNTIQNWSAPLCTSFLAMFQGATAFNQPLTNLVNTSGVASCTFDSMFRQATVFNQNIGGWNTINVISMANMFVGTTSLSTTTRFNNGETGLQSIANIVPSTSSYTNTTKVLNCPGATFTSTLAIGDVLIIQTSTIVYSSSIESITNDQNLVLTTAYGSDITVGTITSINKQVAGTSPLNWNTAKVTTLAGMFQYCIFFNQPITTSGNIWNTNLVTTVASLFQGSSTALITLFNNGQILTGTTAPMGWTFNAAPTSSNYKLNCRLTPENKPASL